MNRTPISATLAGAWRLLRWPVLGAVLLAFHVVLAPWTQQKTQEIQKNWTERKARRSSAKYVGNLQKLPDVPMEKFLSCATAFRDHLNKRGIKLTVVLWPDDVVLFKKPGVPQLEPSPGGAAMLQAAKALRRERVKVIETLPEIHLYLCLHPEVANWTPDRHLGPSLRKELTDQIYSNLDPKVITRNGRGLLSAGDCYAYHLGMALRTHAELAETHIFWRNAGADAVPYEIGALREPGLQGIHQLIWVVPTRVLYSPNPNLFPPWTASMTKRMPEVPGQRTIRATLTEVPKLPEHLGKTHPIRTRWCNAAFVGRTAVNFWDSRT
jgi:hypothetical protein